VPRWAKTHPAVAEQWIKDNANAVANGLGKDANDVKNAAAEIGPDFFRQFASKHPGHWPTSEEKTVDEKKVKVLTPVQKGADVQAYLFDPWLQAHPDADLELVPADMVMASGSGLDVYITRKNADYQLERVSNAWAEETKRDKEKVRGEIQTIIDRNAEAPFGGLVGVPLVNVLEVNLALRRRFDVGQASTSTRP
jgi:K+-transporting ATPase ATPase C chain